MTGGLPQKGRMMDLLQFLGVFGGLALFLHGMQMMSSGLEAAAGNRMKTILERLTANRFMGILVGALITAAVQSSSATTVMVVGFVNAGIMNLNQAVWLIMGANVGKTTTGLLIAMDVGALAPLVAFAGVAMMVFVKDSKMQHIGQLLAGLGILFIGMDMMSAAMEPLREVPAFVSMMAALSDPILGILFGTLFTALIQSSAASVGILQSLAAAGVVEFSSSVYILFGQNIGTCITAVMASFGVSRDAKRATCVHILFNVIGTVIFTVVVMVFPLTEFIAALVHEPMAQIAVMHVFFNLATTIILFPFGDALAGLAASGEILSVYHETYSAYAASKAAVSHLTRIWGNELAGDNILVHAICPCFVRTPMMENSIARMAEQLHTDAQGGYDYFADLIPTHRLLEIEEIGNWAAMLCGELGRATTGSNFSLTCGQVRL